ncbi:hypothetical protein [Pseudomonas sp. 8 R 14]|nr:hypothetical protein [Pseudomonas sp. 8 R 14]SAM30512.1 hypothetical protein BN1864_LIB5394:00559 [Pseudomonas sp. 1 R 17]
MPSRPVCNLYMLSSMMIGPKYAYRILRQDLSMVEIQNQTKVWETLKGVLRLVEIREEVTRRGFCADHFNQRYQAMIT